MFSLPVLVAIYIPIFTPHTLSGISIAKIRMEDWSALPSLNTIVLPTATIKDPFNIPGTWYYMDGEKKVYLPKYDNSSSRVNKDTSGLEGKTIYKDTKG